MRRVHNVLMKNHVVILAAAMSAFFAGTPSVASSPAKATAIMQEKGSTTMHANGTFEVKLTPQDSGDKNEKGAVGTITIEKQFHGDLEGTSKGVMLAVSTDVKGSAGYVAMEKFTGTLKGRSGTFALQHTGTMNRGTPSLSVTVVPDSGTGQLTGLTGKLDIEISGGKHSYKFDYTLPDADK
jgi:hypothetical protein